MKNAILLLCFILSVSSLRASSVHLTGKVQEKGTGVAIEFADVVLQPEGKTTVAAATLIGADGRFLLANVEEGVYLLTVRVIGYETYTGPALELRASQATHDVEIIELQPLEIGLSEVVVEGRKKQIVYKLDKKIIEAGNLMGGGGTAIDILENTPSVRVDAEGEVTFRRSSGFKVYIDGKPSLYSGTQALQQIPAGQIENIEIVTTPSARYHTRIQLDGNFVGPSVTTQGRTEAFWFVNLAIRRPLFHRNLQSTLSFRDIFHSARYRSRITTPNLESMTRIHPQFPVITLSISFVFNNFKQNAGSSRDNRDLFEGVNH